MRQDDRNAQSVQNVLGGAAKHEFLELGRPVGAHDYKARLPFRDMAVYRGAYASAIRNFFDLCGDAVRAKVPDKIRGEA